MSTVHDSFIGFAEESTWATGVAVSRFTELISEGIAGKYDRIESAALRAGSKVMRSDRFVPNPKGAAGDVKLEVLDKGFGFLVKHMMGGIATAGAGPYTHTGTPGALLGKSLTAQVGRVANDGTLLPTTYEGGKIDTWELSNGVDGVLNLGLGLDFARETAGAGAGVYALATPSYPSSSLLLTFAGGTVTIGGTEFAVADAAVKGNNNLKKDRYFLRTSGTTKKEQIEDGVREFGFNLKGEFESLTHFNRVASSTVAGTLATVVLLWQTASDAAHLKVTIQNARFDDGAVNFDGVKTTEQPLSGKCLYDGTNAAVSIEYKTGDATP